ncbi:prominin-like protein [Drosophila obscura]|uniref:prominin-like protein n=1 Tax=Drosophila obscura TaxID=7282 RepID=UPI001BB1FE14|nr:prominin-like protein [Drosophila obscura]XP_022224135.2 prominin-like protein [Drosophila obscura]
MADCTITESKQSVIKTIDNCARKRRESNIERTSTIGSLFAALFLIVLVTRVDETTASPSSKDDPPPSYWRKGYSGHGTTHEELGSLHFAEVEFSQYVPSTNYSQRENITKLWVDVVFKLSRKFFDKMFPLDPSIPRGYIKDLGKDNMRLGPMVIKDDWAGWLNSFWLMWVWTIFMVALAVLAPFAGVLYFCFCCHRCKLGCPACHSGEHKRKICVWGTCLMLFLPFIAASMGLAFLSNGMLERGIMNTQKTLEMGSVDTCNFLKDVGDHIHHLFVVNYEELETHLISTIMDAPKHLFKDLNEVAEGNAVAELARIFRNLGEAAKAFKLVEQWQETSMKDAYTLRNTLRSVKRDADYAAAVLCGSLECIKFLHTTEINFFDTSKCLHLDEMPEPKAMIADLTAFEKYSERPVLWLARLRNVSKKIKNEMERVSPPIIRDIRKGRKLFAAESRRIDEIIEVVISDIHLGTIRASRAFEDLYDKFNETRYYVVLYIAVAVGLQLIILVLALLMGCLLKRPTGSDSEYFTTRIASYLLLLSISLIFCMLSVILMVSLFYFVIGGVAYKGACAPLRKQKQSALLKHLDSQIDLRTMFSDPGNVDMTTPASNQSAKAIKVSSVIKACEGDNYLFNYLLENRIFDINDFLRVKIVTPAARSYDKDLDLSKDFILTEEDREVVLTKMEDSPMGLYHSSLYMNIICEDLNILNMDGMGQKLRAMGKAISWNKYPFAAVAFEHGFLTLKAIKPPYFNALSRDFKKMAAKLYLMDKLILYENFNFADSLKILKEKVVEAEKFIQNKGTTYISTLGQNLTAVIEEQINAYIRMIVNEAHTKIGRCKPLTYIYERGLDLVCKRIVDPINGYWIGVLMAAFLLIPVAFIAHRLQCLFKQHRVVPIRAIRARKIDDNPCPFCHPDPKRTLGGQEDTTSIETVNIDDADRKNKLD